MERKMENDMKTRITQWYTGIGVSFVGRQGRDYRLFESILDSPYLWIPPYQKATVVWWSPKKEESIY